MTIPAHLRGVRAPQSEDKLLQAREMADRFAGLEEDIEILETQIKDKKAERLALVQKELPEFFASISIDNMGLPERNVDVVIVPYFKASISADWPIEQQEAAFAHLDEKGHGGVIRSVVTVAFPKEEFDDAKEFVQFVRDSKYGNQVDPILGMSVPWNSLTSLVKSEYEKSIESGKPLDLDLEKLGAIVGRIAKIKKRKS